MQNPPQVRNQTSEQASDVQDRISGAVTQQFDALTATVVKAMQGVSTIADKSVSTFLLAFGTVVVFTVLILKLELFGFRTAHLEQLEFVVVIAFATILMISGAYLRFYHYRTTIETAKELREIGREMLKGARETELKILEGQMKAADAGVGLMGTTSSQDRGGL
ncbi:MAG TPA: hypothetical protein VJ183_19110 [Chloroflexia bacterium]|nr:hypothetical protein [Chloroflexia bacterium]